MVIDNEWSRPEGDRRFAKPVRYRILNTATGEVEEHRTTVAYDETTHSTHHALAAIDQFIANELTSIIQAACANFWAKDEEEYQALRLEGVPDIVVSDDDIRERIRRLELGENYRESARVSRVGQRKGGYYRFSELPWDQQRALVEQLLKLRRDYRFEIIGQE
jgi:hypothetical protein